MSVCVPHPSGQMGEGCNVRERKCDMTKSRGSVREDMSGPDQERTDHCRMDGWYLVDAFIISLFLLYFRRTDAPGDQQRPRG